MQSGFRWRADLSTSWFHPSYGDWVRLLHGSGFVVEALHEIFAPPEGADHPFYEIVSAEWAASWPAEELWVAIRP